MPSLILTESAQADLVRLRQFLRQQNPQAASRFGHTLAETFDLLERNPHLGRPVESVVGLHRLVISFGSAGYVLHYRYRIGGDSLQVLTIRHSREAGD